MQVQSPKEQELGLRNFPELGHVYEPWRDDNVRVLVYGHYRIVYQPCESGDIHTLGVLHGALDLKRHRRLRSA